MNSRTQHANNEVQNNNSKSKLSVIKDNDMKCSLVVNINKRVRDKPNKIKIFVYEAVKVCKS